ncbi:MAG: exo-alpha-sialidase [Bacteroidales bacterium]|nr:exo-alpha-sialidase [Bacteroidales bacterium]
MRKELKTWVEKYCLLLDEGYNRGYSCLTSIDENTIGIFYEGSQAHMTFESIPLNELINK